jgi:hypothetical protein
MQVQQEAAGSLLDPKKAIPDRKFKVKGTIPRVSDKTLICLHPISTLVLYASCSQAS